MSLELIAPISSSMRVSIWSDSNFNKALDKDSTTFFEGMSYHNIDGVDKHSRIILDFGVPVCLTKYSIVSLNNVTPIAKSIKNIKLLGHNVNSNIGAVVINTVLNTPQFAVDEKRHFEFQNQNEYRYYILEVDDNYGSATNGHKTYTIVEAEFYHNVFTTKHLIKSSNKIQVLSDGIWVDTELVEPLTKLDFETHGMDDLSTIPSEKWQGLDEEFEIITWTDDLEDDKFIEITTDPFSPMDKLNQEEEFEVLTWSDEHEVIEKTNQGVEQVIDSGKMFKTTIEDFATIVNVEVL